VGALGLFQVVGSLEVQPEVHGGAQCLAQTDGAVHGDAAAFLHEIIDPAHWQTGCLGELGLRDAAFFEHFLPQDAAWMDARQAFGGLCALFRFGDGFHGSVVGGQFSIKMLDRKMSLIRVEHRESVHIAISPMGKFCQTVAV